MIIFNAVLEEFQSRQKIPQDAPQFFYPNKCNGVDLQSQNKRHARTSIGALNLPPAAFTQPGPHANTEFINENHFHTNVQISTIPAFAASIPPFQICGNALPKNGMRIKSTSCPIFRNQRDER